MNAIVRLAVVRLDDVKFPGNGGRVVELTDEPAIVALGRHLDRDGAIPEWLRLWQVGADVRVGDYVRPGAIRRARMR